MADIRELSIVLQRQWRRQRHRGRQKSNWFGLAKQPLCRCITLFSTFLCCLCTTTTWKCLISRFMEDAVNEWPQSFLSLSKLEGGPQGINFREIRLHVTFSADWKKRDKVRKNANWFLKWLSRLPSPSSMLNWAPNVRNSTLIQEALVFTVNLSLFCYIASLRNLLFKLI